jgi:hypothetical protein
VTDKHRAGGGGKGDELYELEQTKNMRCVEEHTNVLPGGKKAKLT